MALWVLRAIFLVIATAVGISIVSSPEMYEQGFLFAISLILIACAIVSIDILIRRKPIEIVSCTYFGILVGLLLTYIIGVAVNPILQFSGIEDPSRYQGAVQLMVGVPLCYICISVLIQTRSDFRFIIPYVEFSRELKGILPWILDTSVIIDGRIADLVATNIMDNRLLMPRFILQELQNIADSSDKLRRSRGRRGLDILQQLQNNHSIDFSIDETDLPQLENQPVDMKLVLLAQHLGGKIVTGDYNLNKVAQLNKVPVINLNDIAKALKPTFLPGEMFDVKIVKAGEGDNQGVGYLDDGTMIVVENGRDHVDDMARVSVTRVLQTSAGQMIFTDYEEPAES
jgi:uncharacterized protein YacL